MIYYCGSGSYFGKVLVPVPVPVSVPNPDRLSTDFQQQIFFIQNLAFSLLEAALFPRNLA